MYELLALHATVLRPGAFAVVNICDVRTWPDPALPPGPYAERRHRQGSVTAADVAAARRAHPDASDKEITGMLGCSDQTVARREQGSAHRAGRRAPTRVLRTSAIVEDAATAAGLYLYDHRIWSKTPAWKNKRLDGELVPRRRRVGAPAVLPQARALRPRPRPHRPPRVGGVGQPRDLEDPLGRTQGRQRAALPPRDSLPRHPHADRAG